MSLRIVLWSAGGALLLAPGVAMHFTDQVRWGPLDFAVFGAMIAGAGMLFEFALRASGDLAYRAGAALALATAFLIVWISLAVGIIGATADPANLLYAAVLAISAIGAAHARLRAEGMARAMRTTGIAQALVAPVALSDGLVPCLATLFFATLWLASAWLFGRASRRHRSPTTSSLC